MRISVQQFKGGAGKSTTCEMLASALAHQRRRVILYDTDPQGSLVKWQANAAATELTSPFIDVRAALAFDALVADIEGVLADDPGASVIIDTAGAAQDFQDLVAQIAELVIVPTRLNAADGTEAIAVVTRLDDLQAALGKAANVANSVLLFTLTEAPSAWTKEARLFHDHLSALPHLKTQVRKLSAFEKMQSRGPLPEIIEGLRKDGEARVRIQAREYMAALNLSEALLAEVEAQIAELRHG
ncbi:MAG: AAA family ATPase [Pseudomonadota bacterium]